MPAVPPAPADPAAPASAALMTVAQVEHGLAAGTLRALDCRFDLAHTRLGESQFLQGHLPGAVYADLERDLSGARNGRNGRHPLPDPDELAARLRAWGIGPDTPVVAYDASDGCYAARAWWLLRWLGHERVAVLDGGWQAWIAARAPVEAGAATARPAGAFVRRAPLQATLDAAAVLAWVRTPAPARTALLIDARAPDRYEGRNETIDPVAGHVPGAVNRFWKDNLDAHGRLKPPAQLRAEFAALAGGRPPTGLIQQCGSGVTACHNVLALHVAGLPGAPLFPGSWSEWIADPARPVARGPLPEGGN